MAQINFNYRVNMNTIPGPTDPAGYIIGYDLDGSLKQKDYYGNIVVISGTSNQGPQGPQGVPGPVGPAGLTWSGAWVATQSYSQNYAVGYASASWWCISDIIGATSNSSPDLDNIHWTLLAAQGSPGPQGIQGIQGIQGLTGPIGPTTSNFYLAGTTTDAQDNKSSSIWRDGSISIGTSSSSTKLYIFSTQSGAFRLQDGTQGSNYILTSDANGIGTWTPLSSVGISGSASYLPKFTGTSSLGNSNFIDLGTSGRYSNFPGQYVEFMGTGNNYLTLVRSQSSINMTLGNPVVFQNNTIISTNNVGLDIESNGYLSLSSGPSYSEAMRVTSTGNIGIGLTGPSTKLHVFATQSGAFRLQDGTQANGYILTSDSNGVGTWTPLSSVGISGSSSYLPKFTGTSSLGNSNFIDNGSSGFYSVGTDSITFRPGANVFLRLSRSQSSMDFFLGNPGSSQANIIQSINSFGFNLSSQGYLVLSSGPSYSEAMRVTSTGNIGIGTSSPSTKLHISATQSGAFRLQDGTQTFPGYVLTSDENGVGTWQGNPQITVNSSFATASASWNNTTIMCSFNGNCTIRIPDTGLPPNFSFRFIVTATNVSSTLTLATASISQIIPSTLVTFAQHESGVIDRIGNTQNYFLTY